jgi:5'-3' exoribonuclease 1
MGIPYFFKHICTRYPTTIAHQQVHRCDRLFVDLNCAIHQCARLATRMISISRGGHLQQSDAATPPESFMRRLVIEFVIRWIEFVCTHVCHPQQQVFLAIDGVPPRAKMVQQRSRRFISSALTSANSNAPLPEGADVSPDNARASLFNSSHITPGTLFMEALSTRLHEEVPSLSKRINCKEIHVSDSTEPGEGEHKIFAQMRSHVSPDEVVVIYSADADILMLSLISPVQRIHVLREDDRTGKENFRHGMQVTEYSKPKYLTVDVYKLREQLKQSHPLDSMEEFVALSFLLGNDFVPPLSYLRVRDQGIDILVQKYMTVKKTLGQHASILSADGTELNYRMLLLLLEQLTQHEGAAMQRLELSRAHLTDLSSQLNGSAQNWCPTDIKPGYPGWQSRYYSQLFFPSNNINDICCEYVQGLCWTCAYYFKYEQTNARFSDWHYKYGYAPACQDVLNYLRSLGPPGWHEMVADVTQTKGELTTSAIADPNVQLLCVLPPQCASLIPSDECKGFMDDTSKGCVHYYPTKFRVISYLKHYPSDCFAVLPDIDAQHLLLVMCKDVYSQSNTDSSQGYP